MKKLLVALFIAGFVGSCGIFGDDGSDVEEFEPYQVGSFMITSPESAEYVGTNTAKTNVTTSSGDSVYVTKPDGNALTLTNDTTSLEAFTTTFIDSSITLDNFEGKEVDVSFSNYESFNVGGHIVGIGDRMEIKLSTYYNGVKSGEDNGKIFISILHESDGSNFKTFVIETNKMTNAVEDIIQ